MITSSDSSPGMNTGAQLVQDVGPWSIPMLASKRRIIIIIITRTIFIVLSS